MIIILLVIFFVASCAQIISGLTDDAGKQQLSSDQQLLSDVERIVDAEAGVVCWLTSGTSIAGAGAPRGISCLPLKDTLLGIR